MDIMEVIGLIYSQCAKVGSTITNVALKSGTTNVIEFTTTKGTFNVTIPNMHEHNNMAVLNSLSVDSNGKLLYDGKEITPDFLETNGSGKKFLADDGTYKLMTSGTSYDDTEIKELIADNKNNIVLNSLAITDNANNIATNTTDIADIKTKIGNVSMETTATDVTGAIKEVNGNQLDTVSFSADYKNIVLNRKSGSNPYTIPIAAIINHANFTELNDVDITDIGNGKTIVYDDITKKHKYVESKGTDELVKMEASGDPHYLVDLLDKQTIVNDNGVLKVKKLEGQEVTISEINYLKGLTMNVMDLVNMFANGGVKVLNVPFNTYAELLSYDKSSLIEGISYLVYVLADETHDNAKTTYLIDKTTSTPTYFGSADEHRDFTTNPIDLANEVTGKLGASNIDVDSLWSLLTVDDTYKDLTVENKPFSTHGAKALYDELMAAIGNAADITQHTNDTDIHITTIERETWNKVTEKLDKTNVLTSLVDNPNDEQVYNANVVSTEINKKANDTDVIKKTALKTTIDNNLTNDDIVGGKAIYDAIQNSVVGKVTILYEGEIKATGTYSLDDDVNNYDFIVINHTRASTVYSQSTTLTKNEISKCINSSNRFLCVYGYGSETNNISGHFNNNKLVIDNYANENITSIIGYKFGQITVSNKITNPAPEQSYSLDEQLTGGTWIDGKPIYRKTINLGNMPNNTFKDVAHGISNIGSIVKLHGIINNPTTPQSVSLPFSTPDNYNNFISIRVVEKNIRIITGLDQTAWSGFATIEYTKTTD